MLSVALIFGRLTAMDYEEATASDERIDELRRKIRCVENRQFSEDYLDPEKRSIANAVTIEFDCGGQLREVIEYPLGHKRRRQEGFPLLEAKFRQNIAGRFSSRQQETILAASLEQSQFERINVHEYVDLYDV